jgi:hypothetical protein
MTIWEWLQSWYFAVMLLFIGIVVVWLYWVEKKDREGICPTCRSEHKRVRLMYREWMSDYIYYDSMCEDKWHD